MKTKRNELNVAELIETIGGVSTLNGPVGGGRGGIPVYVGGSTVNVPKPDNWTTHTDPGRRGKRP